MFKKIKGRSENLGILSLPCLQAFILAYLPCVLNIEPGAIENFDRKIPEKDSYEKTV